eukprot:5876914-Amphidinium_carterae.1
MASGMMNPNVFGMPSVGNTIAPHVAVSPSTAPSVKRRRWGLERQPRSRGTDTCSHRSTNLIRL